MVPTVTHLQFAIMATLKDGERTGLAVRDELKRVGISKSGPGFYQVMARLEDAKLVTGRYEHSVLDGQPIKERVYELTGAGQRVLTEVATFYAAHIQPGIFWGGLAHG